MRIITAIEYKNLKRELLTLISRLRLVLSGHSSEAIDIDEEIESIMSANLKETDAMKYMNRYHESDFILEAIKNIESAFIKYENNISSTVSSSFLELGKRTDEEYIEPSTEDKLNNLDYRVKNQAGNFKTFAHEIKQTISELPSADEYVNLNSRLQNIEDFLESKSQQSDCSSPRISERYRYTYHVEEQVVDIEDKQLAESFTIPFESLCAIVAEIKYVLNK